jgi:hypothetical protein
MIRRMNDRLPHEVFELLEKTTSLDERVEVLRNNFTQPVQMILQAAFKPDLHLDLPAGAPPYNPDPNAAGLQPSPLKQQIKILPSLLKRNDRLSSIRKETLFIRLIEGAHAKDAIIIIAAKDKKLPELYPLLTESLVRAAFPNLI